MEWIMIAFGLLYVMCFSWNCSMNDKDDRAASAFF